MIKSSFSHLSTQMYPGAHNVQVDLHDEMALTGCQGETPPVKGSLHEASYLEG